MSTPPDHPTEVRNRIAAAAGAALLGAGLILVMFILPAEYAVDPLGTGARLGLLDLGITGQQVQALEANSATSGGSGGAGRSSRLRSARSRRKPSSSWWAPARAWNTSTGSTRAKHCSTPGRRRPPSITKRTPSLTARRVATRKATRKDRPPARRPEH